jgi:hypothetical protein
MKLSQKEFDKAVQRAYRRIPLEIRQRMENVVLRSVRQGKCWRRYPNDHRLGLSVRCLKD